MASRAMDDGSGTAALVVLTEPEMSVPQPSQTIVALFERPPSP